MSIAGGLHTRLVHRRRVRVLARHLVSLIPESAVVLDVGAGDGELAAEMKRLKPGLVVFGLDVLLRPSSSIPLIRYDGRRLPVADRAVDVVMFVDVLHHTHNQWELLSEAIRLARRCVVIKDHTCDSRRAAVILRVMDWVGNARFGVALPFNYWSEERWHETFRRLDLREVRWEQELGLYPRLVRWLFERQLHFVVRLDVPRNRPLSER